MTWTVFILYENSLFARGLEGMLRREGVKVLGVTTKTKEALHEVRALKPDVIIAEAETKKSGAEKLLSKLIREQPQVKVVRVSLEDNTATLYTGRRWEANTVDGLVKGILATIVSPAEEKQSAGSCAREVR